MLLFQIDAIDDDFIELREGTLDDSLLAFVFP
jgi:hypothetical protein